jgi:hypothetical protein
MDVKYIEFKIHNGMIIVIFLGTYAHDAMCRIVQRAEPAAMPVSAGFTSFGDLDGVPSFVFHGKSYSLGISANHNLSIPMADLRGTLEVTYKSPVLSNSDAVLKSFNGKVTQPVLSKDSYGETVFDVQGRHMFH